MPQRLIIELDEDQYIEVCFKTDFTSEKLNDDEKEALIKAIEWCIRQYDSPQ